MGLPPAKRLITKRNAEIKNQGIRIISAAKSRLFLKILSSERNFLLKNIIRVNDATAEKPNINIPLIIFAIICRFYTKNARMAAMEKLANTIVEKLKRTCAVCGNSITIDLHPNRKYSGGHYFGELSIDNKKIEYWECNRCFN